VKFTTLLSSIKRILIPKYRFILEVEEIAVVNVTKPPSTIPDYNGFWGGRCPVVQWFKTMTGSTFRISLPAQ
jgi:hypothetical protein